MENVQIRIVTDISSTFFLTPHFINIIIQNDLPNSTTENFNPLTPNDL
jgi:hypothetical protein